MTTTALPAVLAPGDDARDEDDPRAYSGPADAPATERAHCIGVLLTEMVRVFERDVDAADVARGNLAAVRVRTYVADDVAQDATVEPEEARA